MRDRGFVILYASFILLSAALFVPFVFIKSYATDNGIDDGPAAALVGIIGASSVVGRLGLGALGSRLGATRLMQLSFGTMTASFAIWLVAGDRYPLLVAFAVVMGVAYGGFIALAPAVTAGLFGTLGLGGVLGALYTAAGIGGLVGPPVIGVVIDAQLLRDRHRRGDDVVRRVDRGPAHAAGGTAMSDLRRLLDDGLIHVPGCADALGGRLIEQAGFSAAYVSGFALSATSLGLPDLGLLGLDDIVAATRRIAAATSLPLIVDIDTGFGGPLNVRRTVVEVEAAGAAAVQIEDQVVPKRCGHFDGKAVVCARRGRRPGRRRRRRPPRPRSSSPARTPSPSTASTTPSTAPADSSPPAPTSCSSRRSPTSTNCAASARRSPARRCSTTTSRAAARRRSTTPRSPRPACASCSTP